MPKNLRITDLPNASTLYGNAVVKLATSEGTLAERMVIGFSEASLVFAVPCDDPAEAVPDEIQSQIYDLEAQMTERPAAGTEGLIAATTQLMTDGELQDAARALISIADQLSIAVERR